MKNFQFLIKNIDKKIKSMKNETKKEPTKVEIDNCANCGKPTIYPKSVNVDFRQYYIDGAGQLCKECYNKIYNEKPRA
jgi:hypothetical protein